MILRPNTFPWILKFDAYEDSLEVRIERKDDLPAPDGPMMVSNCPDVILPERLFKIRAFVALSISERLCQLSESFKSDLRKESFIRSNKMRKE
jgi:hypothetical protein